MSKAPKAAEDEARKKADAIDDVDDEEYKKSLRLECRSLQKQIDGETRMTGLYNDERLRINYFWLISKKELEDKQAELRNKERELQDLTEKHQIEQKIYKQRCKHLIFQNLDQLTELKKEAQVTLKNVEDENRINERELKQDLRAINVSKKEQEVRHKEYLNAMTRDKNREQTRCRQAHERICNEIHLKFQHQMKLLREEKVRERRAAIKKIQEKKDAAIEELTSKHEIKYEAIRSYYVEITNTNLDIINQLASDLDRQKRDDKRNERAKFRQERENNAILEPMTENEALVKQLEEKKIEHDRIKGELQVTQAEIAHYDSVTRDIDWQYEVRLQQYQYLEREKQQLFDEFHKLVYEIHQKTGIRNLILEKKYETIQESLETKDAQINQLLAAARIEPEALGVIRSTLEEVENLKSDAIREIQASLKKIREAHSNMVKTYEGKLSEFGIPVEELGFDPLVPANI